jgi:hypothetical protein
MEELSLCEVFWIAYTLGSRIYTYLSFRCIRIELRSGSCVRPTDSGVRSAPFVHSASTGLAPSTFLYLSILIELARCYNVIQQHSASASLSIAIYSCNLHGSDRVRASNDLAPQCHFPSPFGRFCTRSPRLVRYVHCTSIYVNLPI